MLSYLNTVLVIMTTNPPQPGSETDMKTAEQRWRDDNGAPDALTGLAPPIRGENEATDCRSELGGTENISQQAEIPELYPSPL